MSKFGEKLKQLRQSQEMTLGQVETYSGISKSLLSRIESGDRTTPKPETLEKIANGLKVNKNVLFEMAGILPEGFSKVKSATVKIPIYGTIFAGSPTGAEEDLDGEIAIPDEIVEKYGRDNLFALRVKGDSMNNVLQDGELAILNRDYQPLQNGHIYAVLINDSEATLKRVYSYEDRIRFEPDSNNPDNKSWLYTKEQQEDMTVKYSGELVYATRDPKNLRF